MENVAGRRSSVAVIIFVCFLIAVLEGYDIQSFGVAAPRMVAQLGFDPSQQGILASITLLGMMIGAAAGGAFSDRWGRRPILLFSVIAFGVFTLATAFTSNFQALLLVRLATGLGMGGALPNLLVVATEISRPGRQASTVTMMFCGLPFGGALVAILGQTPLGADWRNIFIAGGMLPLLVAPAVYFFLPETRPAAQGSDDRGVKNALFGEGRTLPTLLLWLASALTLLMLYLMLNWLPSLVVAKGFTPEQGAASATAFGLTSIVGSLLIGVIADRVGYRWSLLVTFVLLAVVMFLLSRADELPMILVLSGLSGFFILASQYALYAFAPLLYPPGPRATACGAAVVAGRIGAIIGPFVAGQMRAAGLSPDEVIIATIPFVVVGAIAAVIVTSIAKLNPTK